MANYANHALLGGITLFVLACIWALWYTDNARSAPAQNVVGQVQVVEIYLKDGTHCATLLGPTGAGITCDWKVK